MQPNLINQNDINYKRSMKELLNKVKFSLPQKGSILDGEVISVSLSNVLLDLGPLGTGIVCQTEFFDDPEKQKELKSGQKIKAVLLELENEEGFRELSLKRAQLQSAWQEIKRLFDNEKIITAKITNLNKGGLITEIAGIQAFMPLSQLSEEHYPKVEDGSTQEIIKILQTYRNKEFKMKIIDYNEEQNKVIVSEKAALQALGKENQAKYKFGDIVNGEITEVTDFGAFVKLEKGVDALIPKKEIDWETATSYSEKNPKEILSVGQKIKAKIIQITPSRIVLSLKVLKSNPWEKFKEKYKVGNKVKGKIVNIDNKGAHVEIEKDLVGLVPSQEMVNKETLETNKEYNFAIIEFEPRNQRLILTPQN